MSDPKINATESPKLVATGVPAVCGRDVRSADRQPERLLGSRVGDVFKTGRCGNQAGLILNAASHAKEPARWRGGAHGIRLWATLIRVIPEYVGTMLEKTTVRWPAALRRRFLSALYYCTRKRWPYTPYRAAAQLGRPVKRAEIAKIYGLRSPATNGENGSSGI